MSLDAKRFKINGALCFKIIRNGAGLIAVAIHVLVLAAGAVTMTAVVLFIKDAPPLDLDSIRSVETTFIFDAADEIITRLHAEQDRVYVELADIPLYVQEAFIAVEDKRFFEHHGFDLPGSLRALWANLQNRRITQGASTITQQLVRSLFLPPDQTFRRKVQEIWLAIQLERRCSKPEILEQYLNQIYFGNGAYGVEAAAYTYFHKSIHQVSTAEAAMLAGIVSSPNRYNPFYSETTALLRLNVVLEAMADQGYLSPRQYEQASAFEFSYAEPPAAGYPHPYYLDFIIHHELVRILIELPEIGSKEKAYDTIYRGGLRVYTTLEVALQELVETVLNTAALYPRTVLLDMNALSEAIERGEFSLERLDDYVDQANGVPQPQAALVLVDPRSGKVLALGGGRHYSKGTNELLRYLSLRQPGSAIKPLVVYAPAFEEKILSGAGAILLDKPLTVNGWTPRNYDGSYRGPVSARQALVFSLNIPAVRLFQMVTPAKGTAYAARMGITTFAEVDRAVLSTALGGVTYGVTVYDMAQAYSVLANGGVKNTLYSIRRIEDNAGRVIYEQDTAPERIISEQTAYIVTNILLDVVSYSTATGLRSSRPIAAKTGTTDQAKDIYLMAYTPNLVAAFWIGYDEPAIGNIPRGWNYAVGFVRVVFRVAFLDLPVMDFTRPEGIALYKVCKISGNPANEYCTAAGEVIADLFLVSNVPGDECAVHTANPDPEPEPPKAPKPQSDPPPPPADPPPPDPDPGPPEPPPEP
ncbi:MAG: PBP1A family penicillin-binding protein [Bacillota bacterium]